MSGQLHAPAALTPGKEPRYPLDRRLGGPQSRSGRREEKILVPAGTRTPTPQSAKPAVTSFNVNSLVSLYRALVRNYLYNIRRK
jgi:hypothetical protein